MENLEQSLLVGVGRVEEACWAMVDSTTVELLAHHSWTTISRETLLRLVQVLSLHIDGTVYWWILQRPGLAATEGQLYRGVVSWAQDRQDR